MDENVPHPPSPREHPAGSEGTASSELGAESVDDDEIKYFFTSGPTRSWRWAESHSAGTLCTSGGSATPVVSTHTSRTAVGDTRPVRKSPSQ